MSEVGVDLNVESGENVRAPVRGSSERSGTQMWIIDLDA
jgi:hypothetical protein